MKKYIGTKQVEERLLPHRDSSEQGKTSGGMNRRPMAQRD